MEIKPAFSEDRVKLSSVAPLYSPIRLIIDISEVCNLKCNYCFRSQNIQEYGYALQNDIMNLETFNLIVESILKLPKEPKTIMLSGSGEPLCNKNLPEMVKILKRNVNSRIEITTNAVLLTKEYAEKLSDSQIDKIVVSLQGLTSEKYKEVCGKSVDVEKFIANLKVLYDNSVNTEIFVKIVDIALEDGEEDKFYEMFKNCCHYAYIENIVEDLWSDDNVILNETENKFGLKIPYQNVCYQSIITIFISPSGYIYPCCQPLAPITFGNIHKISLLEAWSSKERENFLIKQLKYSRKSIKFCNQCAMGQGINDIENDSLNGYEEVILKRMKK